MDRYTAQLTIGEIARIRTAERRRVTAVPAPVAAFGLVNLGGVAATMLLGRYHLALYGLPAFTCALLFASRALSRRAAREGVQIAMRPWAVTAGALFMLAMSASRTGAALGLDPVSTVGSFLGQAIGIWLLARWAHSEPLLMACLLMLLCSAITGSLAVGDTAVAVQFGAYGTVLLAIAGHLRLCGRSR